MISSLRKRTGSFIVMLLMGLLIASFAIWGIGDVFRAGGADSLAMVGGSKITPAAFVREYQNELNRWQQQMGESFTPAQAKAMGMPRDVLQRMVNREVFDAAGRDLGLAVSDAQVRDFIRTNPAFRNSVGQFDRGLYANVLRYVGMSEAQFEAAARADLTREQLLNALGLAAHLPDSLAERLYAYHGESRVIDVAAIRASAMQDIAPPDETALMAYYKEHQEQFTAPEYRAISYLFLTAADFEGQVALSEQDIRAYYDDHAAEYATAETRTLEQMVFSDEKTAAAAADAIRGGADFVAVAKEKAGLNADELALGERSEQQIADELGKDVARAVFATPVGQVAGPVASSFGWHVVKVVALTSEVRRPLEDMRAEIEAKARRDKAIDLLYDATNKIEDELASGATLEEVAKNLGLTVAAIPAVDNNGLSPDGSVVADLPKAANFLRDAFAAEVGAEPVLHEAANDAYYLLRVDTVTPPAVRPLDKVKAAVEAVWLATARDARAKETAETVKAALAAGKPLAAAVPAGAVVQTGITASRLPAPDAQALTPEIRNAAFATTVGKSATVRAADGDGYVVVHVLSAAAGEPAANAREFEEFKRGMAAQYGNDVLQAYRLHLSRAFEVAFNQKLFDETVERLSE